MPAGSMRICMASMATPLLLAARSSGSSGRVMVTGPFSDMPHSEYVRAPTVSLRSSTSSRSTGAEPITTCRRLGVARLSARCAATTSASVAGGPYSSVAP
jgi:hypothetical protein